MTLRDELLIGLWALSIVASVAIIWTPWRLTRGDTSIDLSDQLTGRPISPLHAFAAPAVLLVGPIIFVVAGRRETDVLWRLHALFPTAFIPVVVIPAVQLLLRREILKVVGEKQAERARAQAVFARGRGRSARRPGV
jgi:hypothetical protein